MSIGTEVMGRPKRGSERATSQRPPDERVAVIHLKGTQAYAEWLDDVHKTTHIPKATIIRLAVAEWATRNGHKAPPEL